MKPRAYVVGLPVVITVSDDGSVTYEIDQSEAGNSIFEGDPPYGERVMLVDSCRIEADHAKNLRFSKEIP